MFFFFFKLNSSSWLPLYFNIKRFALPFLLLNSIPLCDYVIIYFLNPLLIDIWVAFSFFITNHAAVNTLAHLSLHTDVRISLGEISRCGIAGSKSEHFTFNYFLLKIHK